MLTQQQKAIRLVKHKAQSANFYQQKNLIQAAGNTSNWVSLGSFPGTHTWLFGSPTTGSGFTLKTDAYINVNINGTAYKLALVN